MINVTLLHWIVVVYLFVYAIANIIVGMAETEKLKKTHYNQFDTFWGILFLIIALLVLLT